MASRSRCSRNFSSTWTHFCTRFFSTSPRYAESVRIVEVGPRDGLQNEKHIIPLSTKIELIEHLSSTGLTHIEAGAFVSPKRIPQMADSSNVLEHLLSQRKSTVSSPISYSFLVPNLRGLENALSVGSKKPKLEHSHSTPSSTPSIDEQQAPITSTQDPNRMPSTGSESSSTDFINNGIDEVSVFAAATETFSQKNINCSIEDSLNRFRPVVARAKASKIRVRAYISVVLGCPYEGPNISPGKVAEISKALLEMGADELSLGDTTGMGTAPRTLELLQTIQAAGIPMEKVAMHFHDTYGQSLVNTSISLSQGIRIFDSSVGGLGGCPYAKGATGNVASEDLVYFLHSIGMETGVDLAKLAMVGQWVSDQLGRENGSRVGKALITRNDG